MLMLGPEDIDCIEQVAIRTFFEGSTTASSGFLEGFVAGEESLEAIIGILELAMEKSWDVLEVIVCGVRICIYIKQQV